MSPPLFPDYDKEHTSGVTGVTGQQRILNSPWHLILPLIFVQVLVYSILLSSFSLGLLILNVVPYNHSLFFINCVAVCTRYCFWSSVNSCGVIWQKLFCYQLINVSQFRKKNIYYQMIEFCVNSHKCSNILNILNLFQVR